MVELSDEWGGACRCDSAARLGYADMLSVIVFVALAVVSLSLLTSKPLADGHDNFKMDCNFSAHCETIELA